MQIVLYEVVEVFNHKLHVTEVLNKLKCTNILRTWENDAFQFLNSRQDDINNVLFLIRISHKWDLKWNHLCSIVTSSTKLRITKINNLYLLVHIVILFGLLRYISVFTSTNKFFIEVNKGI